MLNQDTDARQLKCQKRGGTKNIIEAELKYTRIHTTELESYKKCEPRDGGKKLGFAKRTGLSLALEIEILHVRDLCFAL